MAEDDLLSAAQLKAIIDAAGAGIVVRDRTGKTTRANKAVCEMIGYSEAEFLQLDIFEMSHPDDAPIDEAFRKELISGKRDIIGTNGANLTQIKSKLIDPEDFVALTRERVEDGVNVEADRLALIDGRFLERSYATFDVPGVTSGHLWLYRDVTERERARAKLARQAEELEKLSTRDELTQLLNRRGFLMIAEQQLKSAARGKRRVILFFADMNGLKEINDKLGHTFGDAALVDTANVLRSTFREADLLARLGGDEFVALALDALPENKELIESRLQANFAALNAESGRGYRLTVSVGSALFDPEESRSIEALLAEADTLMYARKKNRHHSGLHVAVKIAR